MIPATVGTTALLLLGCRVQMDQLAGWSVDRLQEGFGARPVPRDIVLLAYDDYTRNQAAAADLLDQPALLELSQWPLPREMWGEALDRLESLQVKAIGFDVMFDLPREGDRRFAAGLRQFSGPVVLATGIDDPDAMEFGSLAALYRPDAALMASDPSVEEGHIAVLGRLGGVVRTSPRTFVQSKPFALALNAPPAFSEQLHQLTGGKAVSQADPLHWVELLRFYGPPGQFRTISLWRLLENHSFERLRTSGDLRGATVLLANTTLDANDLHPTPFARLDGMPGVEIHATALANLRGDDHLLLRRSDPWVIVGLIVWAAVLVSVLDGVERPERRLAWTGLLVSVVIGGSAAMALGWKWVPPIAHLSATTILVGLLSTGEGVLRVEIGRQKLRSTLSKYLSPVVMKEVTGNIDHFDVGLGGKSYDVIVLMTDIRGFTAMTTRATEEGNVNEFVQRLNTYFTAIVEDLLQMNATVDKYVGDAVFSYFGAPISRGPQQDACAAVEAARRVCATLDRLNAVWESQGLESWEQVVVLSAGSVICGNIGSPKRLDYTVIGDAVNRVSRMEAIAKQYRCPIAASEQVVARAGLLGEAEKLGEFPLRGQAAQAVYAISKSVPEGQSSH